MTETLQFYYAPMYINDADTYRPGLDFIDELAIKKGLPELIQNSPRIHLDRFGQMAEASQSRLKKGPGQELN